MILASTSPARRAMLEAAKVPFLAEASGVDEDAATEALVAEGASPRALADALAELKAIRVSLRYPGTLVLGADQVLAFEDGTRLDKPLTRARLALQLAQLSGRRHSLFSAAVLARDGRALWRHVGVARLGIRPLSPAFIEAYAAHVPEAVLQSVGGYHVEGEGVQLLASLSGDLFTVRGLPLLPLLAQLRELGVLPA
ncbi:Maf family protein [Thermaurantiacus sp.]